MKKVILALAIIGSSVGSDCFCMNSMWNSTKNKIGSVMQKVQSNQTVQKIDHMAQNVVKGIKSNRKVQMALGISVLVGGGILACYSMLSTKGCAGSSIFANLKGSYTPTYECYGWLPWNKPICELYSTKYNPSALEKMLLQLGIMKMPVDKVSTLQKFWIDTKVFLSVITSSSPFLSGFFSAAGAFGYGVSRKYNLNISG